MRESKIVELAERLADQFEVRTRDGRGSFTAIKDGAKDHDSLTDLVRACHESGRILPDDWIYEAVHKVLDAIACDGSDATIEPEIYTHELMQWLVNCPAAIDAVDRAHEELGGERGDLVSQVMLGQSFMLDEIRGQCLAHIETMDTDTDEEQENVTSA